MYDVFNSICTFVDATTTTCVYQASTSSPLYIQDAGNISYGIAWLIFFQCLVFLGMIWNMIRGIGGEK